jgi:hypothetical protein
MFRLVARGRSAQREKATKLCKVIQIAAAKKKHIAWCSNFVGDEKFMRHFQVLPD